MMFYFNFFTNYHSKIRKTTFVSLKSIVAEPDLTAHEPKCEFHHKLKKPTRLTKQ